MENELIKKALEFAKISLAGKKRYSGESFVDHAKKVAEILIEYKIQDPVTLAAALLHHALSDGAATSEDIEKEFGTEISSMLVTLESLRIIKVADISAADFAENLRKLFLTLAKDLRIVLIKLADVLDNLRTIQFLSAEKQQEVALETMEIFAPLTERLGIGEMKGQMQDLVFPILYPQEYKKVIKLLKIDVPKLNKIMLKIKAELELGLEREGLSYQLESRTKHLYSLYLKLNRPSVNFDMDKVYDLIAFRVIVKSVEDCYKTLGVIHSLWRPMPNYVRDYIANPRPNGYQSIHTTVFGPLDKPCEIQIRTYKMHEQAEYGIAAHWSYTESKEKGASGQVLLEGVRADLDKLAWVKALSQWQEEILDNEEFLKSVKTDLFGTRIFCFTPKGDVKDLPAGSTPIDFAYAVHSDLGNLASGAKVNGKLVSLDTKLQNTDVVEILVSKDKNKKPSRDWLKFVVTSLAKRRIRKAVYHNN